MDAGVVSFDIKTEDPVRTVLGLSPITKYALNKLYPNQNLTHETKESLYDVGSYIQDSFWDAVSEIDSWFD